jgi:hypothetical protein
MVTVFFYACVVEKQVQVLDGTVLFFFASVMEQQDLYFKIEASSEPGKFSSPCQHHRQ